MKRSIAKEVEVDLRDREGNPIAVFDDQSLMIQKGTTYMPLKPGPVTMIVTVDLTQHTRGDMHVLNRKNDVHACLMENLEKDPGKKMYTHTFQIRSGKTGLFVLYKESHVKIYEHYKNGRYRVWELGITMRGKQFFLVCQAAHDSRFYRDGNSITSPTASEWQSLRKITFLTDEERTTDPEVQRVVAMARGDKEFIWPFPKGAELPPNLLELKNLEPIGKYVPAPAITAEGLRDNQGRVLFWNEISGTGAIVTREGNAKIHCSKLADKGLVSLKKGEIVTFHRLIPPNDERTTFKFEAIGVKPDLSANTILVETLMAI